MKTQSLKPVKKPTPRYAMIQKKNFKKLKLKLEL